MSERQKKIKVSDFVRIYLRSFLLQASWSFDRMQSLGFAYAMLPALKRLYPDREEFAQRVRLHMEYFNTQPYLASFILGAAVRIEEERALGRTGNADVSCIKDNLSGPLGALGDSFFWGALKPLSVMMAIGVLMTGAWWAPLLFLTAYNSWHLVLRADLLLLGYDTTGDVVALMARYRFTRMARLFKAATLAVLGGVLGMMPLWRQEFRLPLSVPGAIIALVGLLITLALIAMLRKRVSPGKLMIGLAAVCVALAYAGVA